MPRASPDGRYLMMGMAAIELVLLLLALSNGGEILDAIEKQTDCGQCGLRTLVHFAMAATGGSLFSLLAVTAYYTLGGLLFRLNTSGEHAYSGGSGSSYRLVFKVANIAIGAVGIAANGAAIALFGACIVFEDMVRHGQSPGSTTRPERVAMLYSIFALVLKLSEALLGHIWAIHLSSARDSAAMHVYPNRAQA